MANDGQSTPKAFFDKVNRVFNFTLDAAASKKNHKCEKYFTKKDNSLKKKWTTNGYVWLNPPYSKSAGGIKEWLEYAHYQRVFSKGVVCLIPADVSTQHFHFAWLAATEIIFLKGRLAFNEVSTGAKFSSMLVIFEREQSTRDPATVWDWKNEYFSFRY